MLWERIARNAWAHESTQALFRESCTLHADKTAIVYRGERVSYRQFLRRVDRLTQALLNAGIGKGDVVSTLPSPTPDFAAVFFAALQAGATINPLNLMWERDVLAAILKRNAPRVLVTVGNYSKRNYVELLEQCLGDTNSTKVLVADDAGEVPSLPGEFTRLRDFEGAAREVDSAAIEARVRDFDPMDAQFICQTSGSTGLPKSALWNHRSPLSTAHFLASELALAETDRWINLSPFFHNSGMCCTLTMGLAYVGCTLHLFERFSPDDAVDAIQNEGIEGTFGFSAHWIAMRGSPKYRHEKFTLKKALIAGPPKFYRVVRDMCAPGVNALNLYAQTENGPLISLTELGNVNEDLRAANSGRLLPGVEAKVCGLDDNKVVLDGTSGQIWYKSPYLFLGYLQEDHSVKLPLDADGYFGSGDYGFLSGGYLTYVERLGGVVKSGGENVSLAKVSETLNTLFSAEFANVHAVAIPDPYWGDRVVAVARPRSPGAVSIETLKARCKEALAGYEVPRDLLEWQRPWPVSPEGKLDVKELRQYAIDHVDTSRR